MKEVIEFINNHKIQIGIIVAVLVLIIAIVIGIFVYRDNQNKEYQVEEISEYKYYLLYENGKMGVIDTKGNVIIDAVYDSIIIPNPQKEVFVCEKEETKTILNASKEELFTEYEEVNIIDLDGVISSIPYEKQVLSYKQNGKYGLINYEGKIITKPIYDSISGLENKEGELLVKQGEKFGVINQKGARIIKSEYDYITADGYYNDDQKYSFSRLYYNYKNRARV